MFRRFLPRQENFFTYFNDSAQLLKEAAVTLQQMVGEPNRISHFAHAIASLEHRADEITHRTLQALHKTFITPLDRDDIHELITQLDDILDLINAAAQRIRLYEVTQVPREVIDLADVCVRATAFVAEVISLIKDLKHPEKILDLCVEINSLENEGDQLMRQGLARLFKEESDVKTILKQKEIIETLEAVTDSCEDVANTVEGVVLEYA